MLLCGRYKAVDERVAEHLVDGELSIGDFVISGGEPAALCVVDAVARLLPDVVGDFDSVESDSFHSGVLDAPYYTRPAEYRGWKTPDVLLSGNHAAIAKWRREQALRRTAARRPDLLEGAELTAGGAAGAATAESRAGGLKIVRGSARPGACPAPVEFHPRFPYTPAPRNRPGSPGIWIWKGAPSWA